MPVATASADINIQATTTAVDLGIAMVVDVDEQGLIANADMSGPFAVGTHTIIWSAPDSQGHSGTVT